MPRQPFRSQLHGVRGRVDRGHLRSRGGRARAEAARAAADVQQPGAAHAAADGALELRQALTLVGGVVQTHVDDVAPARDAERVTVVARVVRGDAVGERLSDAA